MHVRQDEEDEHDWFGSREDFHRLPWHDVDMGELCGLLRTLQRSASVVWLHTLRRSASVVWL